MQNLIITEEQNKNIQEKLEELKIMAQKYLPIECIYYFPYYSKKLGYNLVNITIIDRYENDIDMENYVRKFNDSNYDLCAENKFGIRLIAKVVNPSNFSMNSLNLFDVSLTTELLNSSILYDEIGKYGKIKKELENEVNIGYLYKNYEDLLNITIKENNKVNKKKH